MTPGRGPRLSWMGPSGLSNVYRGVTEAVEMFDQKLMAVNSQDGPSETPARPASWASYRVLVAALLLLACVPYVNMLFNGFVYDDDLQLLANPYVRNFHYLRAIFTGNVWSFSSANDNANYYRPLMTFGYALCHALFGFRAYAFHMVSLGFNLGVVYVLFVVTRRLFRNPLVAFLAAGLFALHPIHTEAVDWIAAVPDLELAFFFLLAFWFFLRLGDSPGAPSGVLYVGMTVSYALALLSKEPAATLPFLAAFFEHTCREDRSQTSWVLKLRRYAAFWLLLIAYILFRVRVLGAFVPTPQRPHISYNQVFFTAIALLGQYLEKMIWPVHMCALCGFMANFEDLLPVFLGGACALVMVALLLIYFWRRDRLVCFGLVWFFVALAPVLNARWMPPVVFSERYLYLPSVGLCWVAALAGIWAWEKATRARRRWRQMLVAAACAVAALFGARIVTRNPDWKNDQKFYQAVFAVSGNSGFVHNNLGMYYWQRGDLKNASEQWYTALKILPRATFVLDNLGLLNRRLKRYREAIDFYERSLAISPDGYGAHTGLGELYEELGMRQQAQSELLRAIDLRPSDMQAKEALGQLYLDEGKYAQAGQLYEVVIQSLPSVRAYTGLAAVRWTKGDQAGAMRLFAQAMKFNPRDSRPYAVLGLLYVSAGRLEDAIREYEAALKLDPTNRVARLQLAKLEHPSAAPHPAEREPSKQLPAGSQQ